MHFRMRMPFVLWEGVSSPPPPSQSIHSIPAHDPHVLDARENPWTFGFPTSHGCDFGCVSAVVQVQLGAAICVAIALYSCSPALSIHLIRVGSGSIPFAFVPRRHWHWHWPLGISTLLFATVETWATACRIKWKALFYNFRFWCTFLKLIWCAIIIKLTPRRSKLLEKMERILALCFSDWVGETI